VVPGGSRRVITSATTPTAAAAANAAVMPSCRFPPAPAATAAPPTPMPTAVPSTSARFSDADARPSPPGGAIRSIISEVGAYASPMPRPATVHAARPSATGTPGRSARTIPAIPARMITSPVRTKRRPSQVSLSRACTQAPAVQPSVAPVTAMPATTGLRWRTAVIASVT